MGVLLGRRGGPVIQPRTSRPIKVGDIVRVYFRYPVPQNDRVATVTQFYVDGNGEECPELFYIQFLESRGRRPMLVRIDEVELDNAEPVLEPHGQPDTIATEATEITGPTVTLWHIFLIFAFWFLYVAICSTICGYLTNP